MDTAKGAEGPGLLYGGSGPSPHFSHALCILLGCVAGAPMVRGALSLPQRKISLNPGENCSRPCHNHAS